jgi:predicted DNA-binding protein (UPF0251 family)
MPNKKRNRRITMPPPMEGFKPFGISFREEEAVSLLFEEFEAIRLADYENLTQEEAASKMDISRPTFTRLYEKARKKIAKCFVEGKTIMISGGNYVTDDYWYKCKVCNETMITLKPVKLCRNCESEELKSLNRSIS